MWTESRVRGAQRLSHVSEEGAREVSKMEKSNLLREGAFGVGRTFVWFTEGRSLLGEEEGEEEGVVLCVVYIYIYNL